MKGCPWNIPVNFGENCPSGIGGVIVDAAQGTTDDTRGTLTNPKH